MRHDPHAVDRHFDALELLTRRFDAHPDLVVFHYVRAALEVCDGNISATARRLGMHRRSLQRMLERPRPRPRVGSHD